MYKKVSSEGQYPGDLTGKSAKAYAKNVIAESNSIWKNGMLQLVLSEFNVIRSTRFFDMRHELVSLISNLREFIRQDMVNIFLVDSIINKQGVSCPPGTGKVICLDYFQGSNSHRVFGNVLAHELGHFFQIHHPSAKGDNKNIMRSRRNQTDTDILRREEITTTQIEKAQWHLHNDAVRRGMQFI